MKDELKKEMKEEVNALRQEVDHGLAENVWELHTHKTELAEAHERIADLEEWKTDTGEAMMEMLEQTRLMLHPDPLS